MKKTIFVLILAIAILSGCYNPPEFQESYSILEVKAMIATKKMIYSDEPCIMISNGYTSNCYPIVMTKDSIGYYPNESRGAGVRYYSLEQN